MLSSYEWKLYLKEVRDDPFLTGKPFPAVEPRDNLDSLHEKADSPEESNSSAATNLSAPSPPNNPQQASSAVIASHTTSTPQTSKFEEKGTGVTLQNEQPQTNQMDILEDFSYHKLLRILLTGCYDKKELRALCKDIGTTYDELGGGGLTAKALNLIDNLVRQGQLPKLVNAAQKEREHYYWGHPYELRKDLNDLLDTLQRFADGFEEGRYVQGFGEKLAEYQDRLDAYGRTYLLIQKHSTLPLEEWSVGEIGMLIQKAQTLLNIVCNQLASPHNPQLHDPPTRN